MFLFLADSTYIQQLESQVQQLEKEKTDLQVCMNIFNIYLLSFSISNKKKSHVIISFLSVFFKYDKCCHFVTETIMSLLMIGLNACLFVYKATSFKTVKHAT